MIVYPSGLSLPKKRVICLISSGANHSSYISDDGYLYVFGSTLHGKLGIENMGYTNISNPIVFPLSKHLPV